MKYTENSILELFHTNLKDRIIGGWGRVFSGFFKEGPTKMQKRVAE